MHASKVILHAPTFLRSRYIRIAEIHETLYPAKLRQLRHVHRAASLTFVSSGTYLETLGFRTYSRSCSTMVFRPPDEPHSAEYQSPVRILSVQMNSDKFAEIRELLPTLNSPLSCRSQTTSSLGTRLYEEIGRTDAASEFALEGLVLEIFAELTRSIVGPRRMQFPVWLKEAKDYFHDNFAESFAVSDVAKIVGVHPVHLSRVFRAKFGCSVGDYLRHLRIDFASRQLANTSLTLCEIAHAAGFSDQSHLNRIFKRIRNVTPNEYRKMSQGG